MSSGADPTVLARVLSAFARIAHEQNSPHATLVETVRAATELVPGCDWASVSLAKRGRTLSTEAASSAQARLIGSLQENLDEGPCLEAAFRQATVRVDDLASGSRWPCFSSAALEAGVAAMLCFRLYVEGDTLGTLNLSASRAGAFTDESEHLGEILATHAAVAYSSIQRHDKMERNVLTQLLIGQAEGILMERHKISGADAFRLLVHTSQHTHIKLRDVAAELVHTGDLHTHGDGNLSR